MEAPDLERRLAALEARLDEMQHAQRMHASAATRRFETDLAQLRQDITGATSRMALQTELQELRKAVEADAGAARQGREPGWQEAAELVPRLMTELARLREEVQDHRPGGPPAADVTGLREALTALQGRLDPLESQLSKLEQRVAGMSVDAFQARLEALEGGAPALEGRLKELERTLLARLEALAADVGGVSGRLDTVEGAATGVQTWLQEADGRRAGLQTRLEALEKADGLAALQRRVDDLARSRDSGTPAPAGADSAEVEALRSRLETLEKALEKALESRPASNGAAAGDALEALSRRLDALESSDAALLALRVESIELGLGVERERVREVFGDLLEEHGLMLRSLENRLSLLLQDVHRLGQTSLPK